MAISKMYGNAMKLALSKEIDFLNDDIKVMLCNSSYAPDQDSHIYKDVSITNEVAGTGYTAGGISLANKSMNYDAVNNKVILTANDISWADSSITARYAIIYDDSPVSNKPLLAYIDMQSDQISNNGTFAINWDANGIIEISTT